MLIQHIKDLVPENMTLGLAILDMKTRSRFLLNVHEPFPLASVAKFITAALAVENENKILPIHVENTIAKHSNEAYRQILQVYTNDKVNFYFETLDSEIRTCPDNTSWSKNNATPFALLEFLGWVYQFQNHTVMNALKSQHDPDGFRFHRFVPPDDWLHMTGGMDGVCNDVGILRMADRTILCAGFMKSRPGAIAWQALEEKMAEIGEVIFHEFGSETNLT